MLWSNFTIAFGQRLIPPANDNFRDTDSRDESRGDSGRGPRPVSIAVRKSNRSTRNVRLTSKVRTRKVGGKAI